MSDQPDDRHPATTPEELEMSDPTADRIAEDHAPAAGDATAPLPPVPPTSPLSTGGPAGPGPSLADELVGEPARVEAAGPETPAPVYAAPVAAAPSAPRPAPAFIAGPAPFPIIVGLLGLAIAITAIVSREAHLTIDWGRAGPMTIVGAGLVLVALGLLGMRSRRTPGA